MPVCRQRPGADPTPVLPTSKPRDQSWPQYLLELLLFPLPWVLRKISGKSGAAWLSVYSATKAAVIGWTQAMNQELAGDGVRSVALCPGFVDTAMTEFIREQVKPEDMIQTSSSARVSRSEHQHRKQTHGPAFCSQYA